MPGARRPERTPVVGDYSNGYVEVDPTGRYGRFDELLGKGAMKSMYRAFDEQRGVEVAWNQANLADVLRTTPAAVRRLYSEVQLLSTLRHDAIIGFHASWVADEPRRSFNFMPRRSLNFITELCSSGTLRSYHLRYPRVSLRAVRSWARQILAGLAYLHAHDPPVIHRDLKCNNLLVHGGQVKIADLGLAAVLRTGAAAHSVVGTSEFMAPEMYDEEYDERVDVYAFGMCMLEVLTLEYPYGECSNVAQIYKKVTAGELPDAFYRVDDDGARRFVGRCLVSASRRPSAAELLLDPFLDDDDHQRHAVTMPSLPAAAPPLKTCGSDDASSMSLDGQDDDDDKQEVAAELASAAARCGMTVTGKLNAEEDTIFLKVQITDEAGHVRNISFPFDVASDTATEVAQEMVTELDITDRDASEIAAMIGQEVQRLLPGREQQHKYTHALHGGDDGDDVDNEERPPPPFPVGVDDYALSDDDGTSSMNSGTLSALYYAEEAQSPDGERGGPRPRCCSKAGLQAENTTFGPGENSAVARPMHSVNRAVRYFGSHINSVALEDIENVSRKFGFGIFGRY